MTPTQIGLLVLGGLGVFIVAALLSLCTSTAPV